MGPPPIGTPSPPPPPSSAAGLNAHFPASPHLALPPHSGLHHQLNDNESEGSSLTTPRQRAPIDVSHLPRLEAPDEEVSLSPFASLKLLPSAVEKQQEQKERQRERQKDQSQPHETEGHHVGGTGIWGRRQSTMRAPMEVPVGFTVKYTAMGEPYLAADDEDEDDWEAIDEHKREKLPLLCSMERIEQYAGRGVFLYFDYVRVLIIFNLVLALLQMCIYIPFLAEGSSASSARRFAVLNGTDTTAGTKLAKYLFVSEFPNNLHKGWQAINSLCIIVILLYGPVYYRHVKALFDEKHETDNEGEQYVNSEFDVIKGNEHFSELNRYVRRLFSYFCFTCLLVAQGFGSFYITKAIATTGSVVVSVIITILVSVLNFTYKKICGQLTNFEKHKCWSKFRKGNTFKFISFKLLNIAIVYSAKNYESDGKAKNAECPLETIAVQFFFLILLDVVAMNVVELVAPPLVAKLKSKIVKISSDQEKLAEFDVSEEYLELLYRQYLVYMALSVFPLVAVLALFGAIVEFMLDKYKLLRETRVPHKTSDSMKTFLSYFQVVLALCSMFTPNAGSIFVLSGFTSKRGNPQDERLCPFMNN